MTDTRRRLLDAAREEFLGPEYDLLAGVVMSRVAERAGVPLRTAKREMKAGELRTALMEDLLRIRPGEVIDSDQFADFVGLLLDRSQALGSQMGDIVDLLVAHNEQSDLFRAMVAFWALSPEDLDVHDRIRAMYTYWVRGGRNGFSALLVEDLGAIPLRPDWITIEDFVRAMTAVIEGLAIQRSVRAIADAPVSDLAPMDPELARKVMLSVFAGMVDLDGVASVDEIFEQVELRRNT